MRVDLRVLPQKAKLGEPRRHRDRVAAEGSRLVDAPHRRDPLHDLPPPAVGAHRHPRADDLAVGDEIGLDAVPLLRAAERQPEAGDHLVENERRAVFVAEPPQPLQKAVGGFHHAHVGGDRLDDDRRDFPRILREEPFDASEVVVSGGQRVPGAGRGHPRAVRHPRRHHARARLHKHRVAVSVVAAREFDELVPPGEAARRAHRAHDRLGTRIDHPYHPDRRDRPADELRHLHLAFGRRAEAEAVLHRALDRLTHRRVIVPENHRPPRADVIGVFPAVRVVDFLPVGAGDKARGQPHRAERPHRAVDPAGNDRFRPREQLLRTPHQPILPSSIQPASSLA